MSDPRDRAWVSGINNNDDEALSALNKAPVPVRDKTNLMDSLLKDGNRLSRISANPSCNLIKTPQHNRLKLCAMLDLRKMF